MKQGGATIVNLKTKIVSCIIGRVRKVKFYRGSSCVLRGLKDYVISIFTIL